MSFRWRVRRRIFIDRRLSRLPIGSQYRFARGCQVGVAAAYRPAVKLSAAAARANRVRMQLPTLRRPVAASALAGISAPASSTRCCRRRGGATGEVLAARARALRRGRADRRGFGGRAAGGGARRAPGRPAGARCATSPSRDRAVAAGILACAGRRRWSSRSSPPPASGCSSARCRARSWRRSPPAAWSRSARCPARWPRSPRCRCCAGSRSALPRPRALGATGVLLITLAVGRRCSAFVVGAVARRLAGARPRSALRARRRASCSASAHGLFWFGSATGRALRARLPARLGSALSFAIAIVAFAVPDHRRAPARGRARRSPPRPTARGACALLLGAARRATDHDGDGFSARFGGGDCDDTRADVYPGAEDIPGDGIDQNCEGGDAKAGRGAGRQRRRAGDGVGRADRPGHAARRRASRATSSSSPSTRSAAIGWASPATAGPPGKSLTPTLDALARKGAYFRRAWSQAPNTPRSFPSILTGRYPSDIAWDKPGVNYPNLLPTNHTFFETLAAAGLKPIGIFSHFYFTRRPRHQPRLRRVVRRRRRHDRRVEQGHRLAAHRPARDRTPAAGGGAQGTLRAVDAPVRAALVVHAAQGVPHLALGRARADGEVRLRDRVRRSVGEEADRRARRARAWRQDTAIVVMADHGEAWGEHKVYFHGQDLFDEQLRVPLIIAVPGQAPRGRSTTGRAGRRRADAARPGRRARSRPTCAGGACCPYPRREGAAPAPARADLRRAAAGDRLAAPRDDDGRRRHRS